MLGLFSKMFIKNRHDYTAPATRKAYGLLCGSLGLFFNFLLFGLKLFAGIISNSVAISADAFNNLSDALSSLVTLFGFKLAGQKADSSHPFGHGRIEYVSGFIVSMLILLMGAELLKSSIKKIFTPAELVFDFVALAILLISIGVKLYMFAYNRRIGRLIHSTALGAIAKDSISDTVATTAVLFSSVFSQYTDINIDAYCGALVAVFIIYSGLLAAKETLNPLLGQAPEPEMVRKIHDIVLGHEKVMGMHDLIIHDYGPSQRMVSLHAEVSSDADLKTIHDLIDHIEQELQKRLHCDAVIHIDPIEHENEESIKIMQRTEVILKNIDTALALHDFRLVSTPEHTKLVFDLEVPFDFKMTDEELVGEILKRIKEKFGKGHTASIKIDKF